MIAVDPLGHTVIKKGEKEFFPALGKPILLLTNRAEGMVTNSEKK
jgi:hypothetical protein